MAVIQEDLNCTPSDSNGTLAGYDPVLGPDVLPEYLISFNSCLTLQEVTVYRCTLALCSQNNLMTSHLVISVLMKTSGNFWCFCVTFATGLRHDQQMMTSDCILV
jgi:hypothetical protein